ncbi:MAG: hypothetical protein QM527_01790 [Alphaproteobacteria bacterium]|nr:hypothetical protein [Alphaproteobacteria bacterium]
MHSLIGSTLIRRPLSRSALWLTLALAGLLQACGGGGVSNDLPIAQCIPKTRALAACETFDSCNAWTMDSSDFDTDWVSSSANFTSMAVDANGLFYISQSNKGVTGIANITKSSGISYSTVYGPDFIEGYASSPGGLATDTCGNTYFTDTGRQQIYRTRSGSTKLISSLTIPSPKAMTSDEVGNLFVAAKIANSNFSIQKLSTQGVATTVKSNLSQEVLSLTYSPKKGRIYYINGSNELRWFDPATPNTETLISLSFTPLEVVSDALGNLYVLQKTTRSGVTTYGISRLSWDSQLSQLSSTIRTVLPTALSTDKLVLPSSLTLGDSGSIFVFDIDMNEPKLRMFTPQ